MTTSGGSVKGQPDRSAAEGGFPLTGSPGVGNHRPGPTRSISDRAGGPPPLAHLINYAQMTPGQGPHRGNVQPCRPPGLPSTGER